MSMGLTARQTLVLDFIRFYVASHGFAPTIEEIQHHLGNKSKSGAHRIVLALEERGAIRRLAYKTRAIELVWATGGVLPHQIIKRPCVTIKVRADGHYMGSDLSGEVDVKLERA